MNDVLNTVLGLGSLLLIAGALSLWMTGSVLLAVVLGRMIDLRDTDGPQQNNNDTENGSK